MTQRYRLIAGGGLILAGVLLAYVPAMNGGFIWDDDFHVTHNEALRDPDGLYRIWTDVRTTPQYYPLTHTTFWVQYQLWGESPFPYHLANVLLHAASSILLWRVLRRLELPGGWLAAAIFALHPVQVESVAWITERKNVLSGLFYLAAAYSYLRYKLDDGPDGDRPALRAWGLPLLSLGLFGCALLSKSVTASLPLALVLVLTWKRCRWKPRDGCFLGAMLLLGAAMGQLTSFLEKYQVGAMGPEWDYGFAERCLIAGRAWWFYLGKLAWPSGLAFLYPRWEIDAGVPGQYLYPLAAVALLAALVALRRKLGWGPLVGLLFFSVTISPALGFFNVFPMRYSFAADHFQYLASIGPIALIAALLWKVLPEQAGRAVGGGSPRAARNTLAAVVLAALAILTFRQGFAYEGLETLWRHTIARNEKAFMAHFNLAKILEGRGELEAAKDHYSRALAAKPDHYEAMMDLGNILADQGDLAGALEWYRRSLEIEPDHALTHYNLALALEQAGRPDDAMRHYLETIRLDPEFAAAHNNLAIVLYDRGEYRAAARELELAREHGAQPHAGFVRALAEKLR